MTTMPNQRASLDAAVAFSLPFGGRWRRASELTSEVIRQEVF